jgi:UDP-N-acetylmuramate--alanine ligase
MSGYARAADALGATVTGSDRADSAFLARLREDRVLDAQIGHEAANLPVGEGVELVYSSAVPPENPERVAARERGVPERPRAELLAELTALRRTIAVAGAHGKTTTSAMALHALRACGMDPGWLIGGSPGSGLANSHWSEGEWLVVEADESDRSMLSLDVEIAVLTNVELDHHAEFASLAQLREVYRAFLLRARSAIVVWDRPELVELADASGADRSDMDEAGASGSGMVAVVPYDLSAPQLQAGGSRFDWRGQQVSLSVPGAHNALNAVAALEAARIAGADPACAVTGLSGFHGAGRRFQRLGTTAAGALVVDDYAHHPTEIAATLRAARGELSSDGGRLLAVFQPHLYSRTERLARDFGAALAGADVVAVLDVYPSRERAEDHPGVSGLMVAEAAAEVVAGREVMWLPSFTDAEPVLRQTLGAGDICVVMGAGNVDTLARRLVGG